MIFRDQAHLEERLAYWQATLRLGDWIIRARIVGVHQDPDIGWASCEPHFHLKEAIIHLRDPAHPLGEKDDWGEPDMELSLVHELIHCHMEPSKPPRYMPDNETETLGYLMWEQAIDQLSKAYVALDRKAAR